MSNIISSFIIDPVLRQARRFSSTPTQGAGAELPDGQSCLSTRSSYDPDGRLPSTSNYGSLQRALHGRIEASQTLNVTTEAADQASTADSSVSLPDLLHAHLRRHSDLGSSRTTNPRPSHSRTVNNANYLSRRSRSTDEASLRRMQVLDGRNANGFRGRLMGQGAEGPQLLLQASSNLQPSPKHSIPEDDGMKSLRRKIQAIHQSSVSVQQKAQRLHELMTKDYRSSQALTCRAQPPLSIRSHRCPSTLHVNNPSIEPSCCPSSMSPSSSDSSSSYNVTAEDRRPSFWVPEQGNIDAIADNNRDFSSLSTIELSYGCAHYKRNVKIQCFECHRWYPCRHCHDTIENHPLNRKLTQSMLCIVCGTPQHACQDCKHCGTCAAAYYCDICKLWDDDATKDIYHCDDCGICRRGKGLGTDFVHCKRCNVCLAISIADSHRCIERATECDCPICGEYLFTSSTSVAALPCGHYMHRMCYDEYIGRAYKCPLCNKSAVNMELLWHELDQQAENQPMPPQYAQTSAVVFCNDCSSRSVVKFHWVGHKCVICGSYNTNDLQILDDLKSQGNNSSEAYPSSPDTSARSPTSLLSRPYTPSYVRSGSYFSQDEQRGSAGLLAGDEQTRFSPYEMLQRMSRSLSPIRQYIGAGIDRFDQAVQAFEDGGDRGVDFWGVDGHFLSGGEEEDNEDGDVWEDYDGDESEENSETEDLEEDDDEGEDNLNGIELPGHL